MQEIIQKADSSRALVPVAVPLPVKGDTQAIKQAKPESTIVKKITPVQPLQIKSVVSDSLAKKTEIKAAPIVVKKLPVEELEKEVIAREAAPLASDTNYLEKKDSFFGQHSLMVKNDEAIAREKINPDWLLAIIFISVAIFTYIKALYAKSMNQTFRAAIESTLVSQMIREESVLIHRVSGLMLTMFLINFSVFLYQAHIYYHPSFFSGDGFWLLSKIFLAVSGLYLLKFLLVNFLAYVFKAEEESEEYIFNMLLFNKTAGLILLPLIIANAYLTILPAKYIFWIGFSIILILFIKRLLRGVLDGISKITVPKTYLILYLCTLEILPALVLAKIILGKV